MHVSARPTDPMPVEWLTILLLSPIARVYRIVPRIVEVIALIDDRIDNFESVSFLYALLVPHLTVTGFATVLCVSRLV